MEPLVLVVSYSFFRWGCREQRLRQQKEESSARMTDVDEWEEKQGRVILMESLMA